MTTTALPESLRTIANDRPRPPSALGPRCGAVMPDISRLGTESKFRLLDALFASIEGEGAHERLFLALGDKIDEMRTESEALKKAHGLPNAFDLLPIVREALKPAKPGDVYSGPA